VMASLNVSNGPAGIFLYENGAWRTLSLFRDMRFDNVAVLSLQNLIASEGKFIAVFQVTGSSLIAQYADGQWTTLVKRGDKAPNGADINGVSNNLSVNRRGDVACIAQINGGFAVMVHTADGANHQAYLIGDITEDGDIFTLSNFELDLRDDRTLYFIGISVSDKQQLYVADPLFQ